MTDHQLAPTVRLANEIAAQFQHRAEEDAAREIATHVQDFWDPRMRRDLIARVEGGAAAELDPFALRAVHLLRRQQ